MCYADRYRPSPVRLFRIRRLLLSKPKYQERLVRRPEEEGKKDILETATMMTAKDFCKENIRSMTHSTNLAREQEVGYHGSGAFRDGPSPLTNPTAAIHIFTVTNAKCHGGGNLLATSHGRKTSQTCSNTAGANWTSHQKSFLNISAHDIDLPLARPVGQTCQQATSTDTTTNNPGLASHVCGKGPGKLSAGNTADLGNFLTPCTNVVTWRRNDISAGQNRRRH
ncbi:hypothetical protein Bbelb_368790 [Branchiostoma belcheri]|nr:hypothetical protein Bbelb_368790 [Branchiostoma belcheri]